MFSYFEFDFKYKYLFSPAVVFILTVTQIWYSIIPVFRIQVMLIIHIIKQPGKITVPAKTNQINPGNNLFKMTRKIEPNVNRTHPTYT